MKSLLGACLPEGMKCASRKFLVMIVSARARLCFASPFFTCQHFKCRRGPDPSARACMVQSITGQSMREEVSLCRQPQQRPDALQKASTRSVPRLGSSVSHASNRVEILTAALSRVEMRIRVGGVPLSSEVQSHTPTRVLAWQVSGIWMHECALVDVSS